MGEMIHTTPENEAETQLNHRVKMEYSHGCIHIKPKDSNRFMALDAFRRGTLVFVNGPNEVVPDLLTR